MSVVRDVLAKYGSRAYYVLRAALEVAEENRRLGLAKLGDFDYRSLVLKLRSWGVEYNPSNLLRVLEREYKLVRTVYRSSNQRWWVFVDAYAVKLGLEEEKERGDPEEELLSIQIAAVDVDRIVAELTNILGKERATPSDERRLKEIVFEDLSKVVEVYKKALNYGSKYSDFISKARKALELAKKAVLLLRNGGAALEAQPGINAEGGVPLVPEGPVAALSKAVGSGARGSRTVRV